MNGVGRVEELGRPGSISYRAVTWWPAPMSPASLASLAKSCVRHDPVLVADQAELRHLGRVEVDLDLDVLGHGHERRAHLLDEDAIGLAGRIDVVVDAVPPGGDLLERAVLDVAGAAAQDGEEHPALGLLLDDPGQFVDRGTDVQVAIGGPDHAVRAVLDEVGCGHVIGELDARPAVSRTAGSQLLDGREDLGLVQARLRGQHQSRGTRVDDDRDPVVLVELLDELRQTPLDHGQLLVHRP